MQGVKIRNDLLFSPSNVKCFAVNNFAPNSHQKNFINTVRNVRNTLVGLERSINKSNDYEQRLLHCKGSHRHSHGVNEWWESDQSDPKSFKCSNTTSTSKSSRDRDYTDYTDSWSSMSVVCLQYQYEELANRYKALIQAYDEQCNVVSLRDKHLEHWRARVNSSRAQLSQAHRALLAVGEKYLALKNKRKAQKKWYEDKLVGMRQSLHDMVDTTTSARLKFDERLENCMANESDSDAALLLNEIRKCNLLYLENMQLKALLEELIPGQVKWKP